MEKKIINGYPHIPYSIFDRNDAQCEAKSRAFLSMMDQRRSVRTFSDAPVARHVIENIILTASTAPSGAHKQPWTFCAVSDVRIKSEIRQAAEKEEMESYQHRMPNEWLKDLAPLGTDWQKPFLEIAPWLIVVFKQNWAYDAQQEKIHHYYVQESVGIACGFLIAAIHQAGLVTLTHTPSPMNFLSKILKRPDHEKPFLLLPVGFPAQETFVPDIRRKPLQDVSVWYE